MENDDGRSASGHDFMVGRFSNVIAADRRAGHLGQIETQSVEALLLFEILGELKVIRKAMEPHNG